MSKQPPSDDKVRRGKVRKLIWELLEFPEEEREEEIYAQMRELCPDPYWSDDLYHSKEFYDEEERLLMDALIEKLFSYRNKRE